MMMTTRGKYAIAAIVELARQLSRSKTGVVKIGTIVGKEFSSAYVEQLFAKMVYAGIVTSRRGPNGGYSLAKKPNEITMLDVIVSSGENVDVSQCEECVATGAGKKEVNCGKRCGDFFILGTLSEVISTFLKSLTLQNILDGKISKTGFSGVTQQVLHDVGKCLMCDCVSPAHAKENNLAECC